VSKKEKGEKPENVRRGERNLKGGILTGEGILAGEAAYRLEKIALLSKKQCIPQGSSKRNLPLGLGVDNWKTGNRKKEEGPARNITGARGSGRGTPGRKGG